MCVLQMYLLDFGASRDYSKQFTDDYIKVINFCNAYNVCGYILVYYTELQPAVTAIACTVPSFMSISV